MNFKIFFGTLGVLIILILGLTFANLYEKHNENLKIVFEKKVVETTFKCIKEEKCDYGNTTLKKLYDLNYLDKQYDPITKAYYNEESYIYYSNKQAYFVEVN